MTVTDQIIHIAVRQNGLFTRKDILKSAHTDMKSVTDRSLDVLLNRMLAHNRIVRVSHGTYKLNDDLKRDFAYAPNKSMLSLNKHIKAQFPFIDYCIWQPSILGSLMQHLPAVSMTRIDVERAAMESVFVFLQETETDTPILLNPSKTETERYITNKEMIIIRPLVKEAPLEFLNGCPVPTLEKMLVDAIADKELQYLQGNESYTIYSNAFSDYNIKKTRLLRYASRRNRKKQVEQILNTLNL